MTVEPETDWWRHGLEAALATADVGLLVIDGDHREAAVRGDLFAWMRNRAPDPR